MRWTNPHRPAWPPSCGGHPSLPESSPCPTRRRLPVGVGRRLLALVLVAFASVCASAQPEKPNVRGLPFTRSYPLEEVGDVPRGARLGFDPFGRLAVIYAGFYAVLNDSAWLDLAVKDEPRRVDMAQVTQAPDGRAYYSALGSWGTAELETDGKLHPHPLVPADAPKWALATSFSDALATNTGVYFSGWNGIAYRDFATQATRFFHFTGISTIFAIGERVFVSAHGQPLHEIDLAQGILRPIEGTGFGGVAIDRATILDETHALIATRSGELFRFDGQHATPWPVLTRHGLTGRVLGLQHLVDGGTAIAINGKGLFLFSPAGDLLSALTTPSYHRVTDIVTREPGVLWVATEDAIEKVLYNSPLSVFGHRLGLSLSWPIVLQCDQRLFIASAGELLEAVAGAPDFYAHFAPVKNRLSAGVWAIAARGSRMLVGNSNGIFSRLPDGRYEPVLAMDGVSNLTMVDDDLCFAIGEKQIGVLRWTGDRWVEAAPRIPGAGFPTVVHAAKRSAWIELGANRVARLALKDGELKLRLFEDFPWTEPRWVNIGIVDDTIVLSGPSGSRIFFDERTETFCEPTALRELLERSPHWIMRVQKDQAGTLWATHTNGVVTFAPEGDDYTIDTSTFDLVNAQFPAVHLLPDNDVWFSAGRALYHVERRHAAPADRPPKPQLVSVVDGRTNAELFAHRRSSDGLRLPFAQNNLSFRFFAGSYAWHRSPLYEFRLNGDGGWSPLGSGSFLSFPELREGRYRVEVRMLKGGEPTGAPAAIDFEILAPWHRTWPAYSLYGLGLAAAVFGIVRWSGHRARHRNLALEKLVDERTGQLKATMERLNAETRLAATLAERDRLAGEIHDSLQQGLSGLMLQLDATLKLPSLATDVRSRLNVARNMVSFTRHEVQHAVWDMESPLLEDTELGDALRKLTALINPGATAIEIAVSGRPVLLPSTIKHHLLRIAQEAITNAVRHASPQRIAVRLDYRPSAVALDVTDDGVGFDPEEVLSSNLHHFGLRGLRTRAQKLRGQLEVRSSPGQGTTVHVVVPLPAHDSPSFHASQPPR